MAKRKKFKLTDCVEYRGRNYPVRTLTIFSKDTDEMTVTIASMELQDAFNDATILPEGVDPEPDNWDDEAVKIDETIYYYVDNSKILELSGKTIARYHLDEPFTYREG